MAKGTTPKTATKPTKGFCLDPVISPASLEVFRQHPTRHILEAPFSMKLSSSGMVGISTGRPSLVLQHNIYLGYIILTSAVGVREILPLCHVADKMFSIFDGRSPCGCQRILNPHETREGYMER